MLFLEIARAGGTAEFNLKLVVFCYVSIILLVLLLCLIVPRIVRGRDKCGAVIQGNYRSNFTVLGVPLATNMFGGAGGSAIAVVMPFVIVLFNVYAVLILSLFAPQEARLSMKHLAGKTLRTIVTNPLITVVVFVLPFLLFIYLFQRCIFPKNYVADLSTFDKFDKKQKRCVQIASNMV